MSKLILFDFECQGGHRFEELVKSEIRELACPRCGQAALRQISPVRLDYYGMALSGDGMETAIDKFDQRHRERRTIEERNEREHGDYGKPAGAD
jgi:hypothetical protein